MREGEAPGTSTREPVVLKWFGEPAFEGESWTEDGLWHLTADELDLLAVGSSLDVAIGKLGTQIVGRLFFLSELPEDEITDQEKAQRALILERIGPIFVKHRREQRRDFVVREARCAVADVVPRSIFRRIQPRLAKRRRDRGRSGKWDLERPAPSGRSGSVAALRG